MFLRPFVSNQRLILYWPNDSENATERRVKRFTFRVVKFK